MGSFGQASAAGQPEVHGVHAACIAHSSGRALLVQPLCGLESVSDCKNSAGAPTGGSAAPCVGCAAMLLLGAREGLGARLGDRIDQPRQQPPPPLCAKHALGQSTVNLWRGVQLETQLPLCGVAVCCRNSKLSATDAGCCDGVHQPSCQPFNMPLSAWPSSECCWWPAARCGVPIISGRC